MRAIVVSQISLRLNEQMLLAIDTASPKLLLTSTAGYLTGNRLGSSMVLS